MDTALDCLPCFMRMVVKEARLACPDNPGLQRELALEWGATLGKLDLTQPPPAIAAILGKLIKSRTGCGDLYCDDKKEANKWVQSLIPELRTRLERERRTAEGDPLALALELAIIGNYIDRGVEIEFDFEGEIRNVSGTISADVLHLLKAKATRGATVLLLGDNTGEIVLDMLLVGELKRRGCVVTHVVRSKPVLNDATMEDAVAVGMADLCEVIESGVDTPGTILEHCTPEFLERMRAADLIISKGQGNFESLQGRWEGIFCAFKVKCKRVAAETGLELGSSALCLTTGDDGGAVDG